MVRVRLYARAHVKSGACTHVFVGSIGEQTRAHTCGVFPFLTRCEVDSYDVPPTSFGDRRARALFACTPANQFREGFFRQSETSLRATSRRGEKNERELTFLKTFLRGIPPETCPERIFYFIFKQSRHTAVATVSGRR